MAFTTQVDGFTVTRTHLAERKAAHSFRTERHATSSSRWSDSRA